ncbi:MAG: PDDEXK nuclease domain-containing protein [Polyangiaceae bacterium]|nr:PDDEXK nuclease domain-containing protein [Polyangiaceae bacterium]
MTAPIHQQPVGESAAGLVTRPKGYAGWLAEVKARVQAAQQRAALAVNKELLKLYWQVGRDLSDRRHEWGAGVIERVSADLRAAFPEMQGFSPSNLRYMRAFAEAWPDGAIHQQPVGELPWGHNVVLLTRLKNRTERLAYAQAALTHGWSRNVLDHHIDLRTVERSGKSITNFERQLPKLQSDLARESLKDPYRFDFLSLGDEAHEREIETALVKHVKQFLLELGTGFAFVGRQRLLDVGGDEFFIDLLFYHLKLRRYVVIELKATKFKPEHLGQLGFYCTAIDAQVKADDDAPTVGLLLCKTKNELVAEYAVRSSTSPIGVSEYRLVESLPKDLEASLPSIARIEEELSRLPTPRPSPRAKKNATKKQIDKRRSRR